MSFFRDLQDVLNKHVDDTFAAHRLRFEYDDPDEKIKVFACICGEAGDRSWFNDHMAEMLKIAVLERPRPRVAMTPAADVERHVKPKRGLVRA